MAAERGRLPPGLRRATELLAPQARSRTPEPERGHLDLLGASVPPTTGPAQDLMLSRAVARVYERWWRPGLGRAVKGVLGPGMAEERRIALRMLELQRADRVLDVACGTGAFTRDFGRAVGREGLAVGIDVSAAMLARAVEETAQAALPQVAYVRGDAQELPFRDRAFDAVCCFAALHLFADPGRALDRMTATLRPGGRIALFTSVRGRSTPLRALEALVGGQTGMRMFERSEVASALEQRGFEGVRQHATGFTQFVAARLGG